MADKKQDTGNNQEPRLTPPPSGSGKGPRLPDWSGKKKNDGKPDGSGGSGGRGSGIPGFRGPGRSIMFWGVIAVLIALIDRKSVV